jgi:hypothetical protein
VRVYIRSELYRIVGEEPRIEHEHVKSGDYGVCLWKCGACEYELRFFDECRPDESVSHLCHKDGKLARRAVTPDGETTIIL